VALLKTMATAPMLLMMRPKKARAIESGMNLKTVTLNRKQPSSRKSLETLIFLRNSIVSNFLVNCMTPVSIVGIVRFSKN